MFTLNFTLDMGTSTVCCQLSNLASETEVAYGKCCRRPGREPLCEKNISHCLHEPATRFCPKRECISGESLPSSALFDFGDVELEELI